MTGEKHLYCVAKGDYTDTGKTAERWQMGIRLWADVSVPTDTGTLPTTGDYGEDSATGTGTGLSAVSNWKWTVGIGTVIVPCDYLINQALPAWRTFITGATLSSDVRLKEVHLYPIDDTGHAFESRSAVGTYATPPVGAASGGMLPPEVSSAVSLRTPVIGRRGRGRIYVPGVASTANDTHGFMTSSWQSNLASRAYDLMHALSINPVGPTSTHVRPIITGKPWTHYGVVVEVDIGNVFDSQRRRRRQLTESRFPLAVPPY